MHQFRPQNLSEYEPSLPLRRGMACSACRLRKKKCDAVKPTCSPCKRLGWLDCDFSDDGASRTYELEKKVATLRTRLRALRRQRADQPDSSTISPGTGGYGSGTSSDSSPMASLVYGNPDFSSVYETRAANHTGPSSHLSTSIVTKQPSIQHRAMEGLSKEAITNLIGAFLSHDQPLWFLHPERFRAAAALPIGHPARIHPALEAVVCLLGIANHEHYAPAIPMLYARATSAVEGVVLPVQALYVLQARVLIAAYAFERGQFLIGQAHLAGAASIVLMFGMYKNQLSRQPLPYDTPPSVLSMAPLRDLKPPRDEVERGERILAFWTVFALERVWGAALGNAPRIRNGDGGVSIEAPWPLEMQQYEHMWADYIVHRQDTIRQYFSGAAAPEPLSEDNCSLAITAKAALLFEYVTLLKVGAVPDPGVDALMALSARIGALATSIGDALGNEPRRRAAFLLVYGARMSMYGQPDDVSLEALQAANGIILNLQSLHPAEHEPLGFLEAAIGIILPALCHTLTTAQTNNQPSPWPDADTRTVLRSALAVLEAWSTRSAFIGIQLDRVRGHLGALDFLS